MITFITKAFADLSTQELYALLRLRSEVFVLEQNCPYLDMDGNDQACLHVLGYDGEQLAAYARLVPSGVSYDSPAIGRVVTAGAFRKHGYGKALMTYCIRETQQRFKTDTITISAQQYLEAFYRELGFVTKSDMYLEDAIPHIKMMYHTS
jgi:ElaA protein